MAKQLKPHKPTKPPQLPFPKERLRTRLHRSLHSASRDLSKRRQRFQFRKWLRRRLLFLLLQASVVLLLLTLFRLNLLTQFLSQW